MEGREEREREEEMIVLLCSMGVVFMSCDHYYIDTITLITPRRLRQSPGALADSTNEPSIPPPPELPANEKAPWINIPSSSYATDWSRHINSPNLSDVTFELGDVRYSAHRLVLCASSDLFRALFGVSVSSKVKLTSLSDCSNWSKHRLAKVTRERVNEGKVEGILSMEERYS